MTSVLPWPQAGCEGDKKARIGLDIERPDMSEWDRQSGVENEAIPVDARAGADRVQILTLTDQDGVVVMCVVLFLSV
jgi:hypothetical protein